MKNKLPLSICAVMMLICTAFTSHAKIVDMKDEYGDTYKLTTTKTQNGDFSIRGTMTGLEFSAMRLTGTYQVPVNCNIDGYFTAQTGAVNFTCTNQVLSNCVDFGDYYVFTGTRVHKNWVGTVKLWCGGALKNTFSITLVPFTATKEGEVDPFDGNDNVNLNVFPNPIATNATIKYTVTEQANVSITVYNMMGQQIQTLVNQNQAAGEYMLAWNMNCLLPSGDYMIMVSVGDQRAKQIVTITN